MAELRKISPEELEQILAKHKIWLEDKKKGKRADLRKVNLRGVNLRGVNLREADLPGVNFRGADLSSADLSGANPLGADLSEAKLNGANLSHANLSGANLVEATLTQADLTEATLIGTTLTSANLHGAKLCVADLSEANLSNANLQDATLIGANLTLANLQNTKFVDANLQDANLERVKGFSIEQLAGANISGIKLPEAVEKDKFEALEMVAETSKNARNLFHLMLLGCLYSWITIATTTDVNLLTDSATSPLPVINAAIPIIKFYWAAPFLLLGFYIYFHLYLQRMWEELSFQPAIFPDGKKLCSKAYPWLLNVFTNLHFKFLTKDRPAQFSFKVLLSWFLAWWAVPITLGYFDWRCLTRHDAKLTYTHFFFFSLSILFMIGSYNLATATLYEKKRVRGIKTITFRNAMHSSIMCAFWGLFSFVLVYSCS